MNKLIKEHLVDRSDQKHFSFSLTCRSCNTLWESPPIRLSSFHTKYSDRLYHEKYTFARESASQEAEKVFGICSLCGNPTCSRCIVTLENMSVCRTCADRCHGKTASSDTSPSPKFSSGWIFDVGSFRLIPRLNYWLDGNIGQRSLFISAEDESFIISFEEGMECLDVHELPSPSYIDAEYRCDKAYLHQRRKNQTDHNLYFHMELPDKTGKVSTLSGQMIALEGYQWAAGVEPILLDILNSLL